MKTIYEINGMRGSILQPQFYHPDLDSFFEDGYRYGSLDKIIICHPDKASFFDLPDGAWGPSPRVLTSTGCHKKCFYFMDSYEWEQIKDAS